MDFSKVATTQAEIQRNERFAKKWHHRYLGAKDTSAVVSRRSTGLTMQPNTSMNPISVGIEEAARLIGVARSMFYEMIANGDIETFKLGRRRLVRVKTLEAFVKRQAQVGSR